MSTDILHRSVRPGADEYAEYYHRYLALVPDGDVLETLARGLDDALAVFAAFGEEGAGFRYAPGKWSVREVAGHLMDCERVFACRALRIVRGDETPLPGFDENLYAAEGGHDGRTLTDLLSEYTAVRSATLALLRPVPAAQWTRRGTANGTPVSVRALAWMLAGHERHHLAIVRERYRA